MCAISWHGRTPMSGRPRRVQAFTTGSVVQVFLLAGNAPTEVWTEKAPGS
jgi:hypothetical protein